MRNYAKLYETMQNMDAQFRANVSICMRLRIKHCLAEFIRGNPRQPADPPKVAQRPPFPTTLLALGARMT